MSRYTHLFFDLDRTLWDYEANSSSAFEDIIKLLKLHDKIPDVEIFKKKYDSYNEVLWEQYRKGIIKKSFLSRERFYKTLGDFDIHDPSLAETFGEKYLEIVPRKSFLVPHCMEILNYLKNKGYELHIITNGFQELQALKMTSSHIRPLFDTIITSDEVGIQKPHKEIFKYALSATQAKKSGSIMIGDDFEADVKGAANFGIDQVYYDIKGKEERLPFQPTFIIKDIGELRKIL